MLSCKRRPVPARPTFSSCSIRLSKEQAVFTVPTRALANDKLAEWRARGWDVGIATGDLAMNLDARVVVATLETQRARFLRREGPKLLVVDEYQMIADPVRGVHYELALALAPPRHAVTPAQRQREKSAGCRGVVAAHRPRCRSRSNTESARFRSRKSICGVCRNRNSSRFEKFLAAHDRESVARGSRAGAGLRAAPQRERRNGAGDRERACRCAIRCRFRRHRKRSPANGWRNCCATASLIITAD